MGDVPAWVGETAVAAGRMEQAAQTFLETPAPRREDAQDAENVLRLARGIRRKMEAWQDRARSRAHASAR